MKELPYFKFEASKWIAGNIQMCSRESKGLFIDLISMYWSRAGELSFKLAVQVLCNGNANALNELVTEDIFSVDDDKIKIKFLDLQLRDLKKVSKARSQAARARWGDPNAMQLHSKSNAIKKRREEKRKEDIISDDFYKFWDAYHSITGLKKTDQAAALKYWKKLSEDQKHKAISSIKNYFDSLSDKKYCKKARTYLADENFNDEFGNKNQDRPFVA